MMCVMVLQNELLKLIIPLYLASNIMKLGNYLFICSMP